MKKVLALSVCIVLCLSLLPGCGLVSKVISTVKNATHTVIPIPDETPEQLRTPRNNVDLTAAPQKTQRALKTISPAKTATPAPEMTISGNSGNREDLTNVELFEFFRQVVFGGLSDGQPLDKWVEPIVVSVTGNYNQQDSDQLTNIFDTLNDYGSFPGVTYQDAAGQGASANMQVEFVTAEVLKAEQPKWSGKSPCYVVYWYDNHEINESKIYLVSDMLTDQAERNYDLTWGVFYSLGLFNDSGMYYDSIFNPYYVDDELGSSFTSPIYADWYLVSMLYNNAVKPGMDYEQAVNALAK